MEFWTGLAAIGTVSATLLSAWGISRSLSVQRALHAENRLLAQRQLLVPMWEHMAKVKDINSKTPDWNDVVAAINTLELVAISVEGGAVDEAVVRRSFGDRFVEMYRKIERCEGVSSANKSGKDYLDENPCARRLFQQLDREQVHDKAVKSLDPAAQNKKRAD